jgi:hypothetical protein
MAGVSAGVCHALYRADPRDGKVAAGPGRMRIEERVQSPGIALGPGRPISSPNPPLAASSESGGGRAA